MEVVGAGANVLAFVGLSANLVRGIKDVHRFFKDFKDAPEDAKRVAEHIKLLNDILVETHIAYKDGSLDPDLTDAIRPCERIIDRLRARVVCFRTEDMGTRQKLWGKFKNAVNKKELNEDLQALDRACDALQRWCHKEDRLMQVGMHDKIQETHSKVTEILEDTRAMRTLIGDANSKDTKMLKYAEITCDETLRTGENVDRICVATSQIQDSVRTQCSIQESGFSRLDEHHDRLKGQVDQILEILQAGFNNTVEDFIQTPPHSPDLVCQAAHLAKRTPLLVQRLRQRPTLDHGYDEMDQMAHLVQSLDNGQTMDPDSHIMDGLGDLTHRLYERVHQTLQSRGTHMGYRMFIAPTIGPENEMAWPPRDTAQRVHTNPTHRRLGKHRVFSTGLQLYNNDRFSSGFFPIAPRREPPGITALISRSDESIDFHDAEDFRRSTGLSQQKTGAESDTYWIRQFAKLTRRTKWNLFLFHVVLKTVNASHTKRKNRARTRAKRTGMSKDDDDRDEILRTTYRNFTFALAQWFASSSGASDGSYGYELKFTTGFNGFAPEGWSCDFKGFHYRPRKGPGGRVFTLCLKAEPGKLRRLLSTGRANVRDVTLEGKNMWHFLAKAADRFMRDPVELACVEHRRRKRRLQASREGKEAPVKSKPKEDTRSDDEFMRDWLEMIDLLLEQGLEPSRRVLLAFKESLLELNYTLDEFTECRLISKLLTGAKYNPFTALGGPIRVYLYQSGYGTCYGILPLHILRAFVLQDEWPIDWARDCITAAISLAFHWSDAADWWRWLEFWVTKDSDDVDEYLDRKLALLKLLVWADAHGPMKSFPVHHALWWAIYGAAEVISVLQYHPDSFREQPYVRDRAAKLWSVERYLGDALKIYIRAANKRLKYFRHHPTLLRYIEGACLAGVGNVKGNRILVDVWDHVYDVLEGELCIGPTTTTTMTTTTQNDTNEPSLELDYGYDYEYDYDYPYVYDDMNLDEALEEAIIEPRDWDVGSVGSVNSVVDGRCSDFSSSSSSDESESYNELDNGRCRRRPRQWGVDGLPKYRWSRQFDVYAWVKTNEMIHRKTTRR